MSVQLEKVFLLNVLLYIDSLESIKKFISINKKCHEVITMLRLYTKRRKSNNDNEKRKRENDKKKCSIQNKKKIAIKTTRIAIEMLPLNSEQIILIYSSE